MNNMSIAGYVAKNHKAVNIFDVYQMSNAVPYSFDSQFDQFSDYNTRTILAVPMFNQRGNVLGVMQIINAQDDKGDILPFYPADEPLISHFATSATLALERTQVTRNIILRMISMAEMRDPKETGAHVNCVAAFSVISGRTLMTWQQKLHLIITRNGMERATPGYPGAHRPSHGKAPCRLYE
ncbi:MAG: GAF domain-containing protein [Desulfatiglandales bacterium]|nr:GAF domain-containing protein [Desulfatiglandales bacterium]